MCLYDDNSMAVVVSRFVYTDRKTTGGLGTTQDKASLENEKRKTEDLGARGYQQIQVNEGYFGPHIRLLAQMELARKGTDGLRENGPGETVNSIIQTHINVNSGVDNLGSDKEVVGGVNEVIQPETLTHSSQLEIRNEQETRAEIYEEKDAVTVTQQGCTQEMEETIEVSIGTAVEESKSDAERRSRERDVTEGTSETLAPIDTTEKLKNNLEGSESEPRNLGIAACSEDTPYAGFKQRRRRRRLILDENRRKKRMYSRRAKEPMRTRQTTTKTRVASKTIHNSLVENADWKCWKLLHSDVKEVAVAQGVWDFGKDIGLVNLGEEGEVPLQLVLNEQRDKMAISKMIEKGNLQR